MTPVSGDMAGLEYGLLIALYVCSHRGWDSSATAPRQGMAQSRAKDAGLKYRIWKLGARCGKACDVSSNLNQDQCGSQTTLAPYLSSPLLSLQKSQLGMAGLGGASPYERLGATGQCRQSSSPGDSL